MCCSVKCCFTSMHGIKRTSLNAGWMLNEEGEEAAALVLLSCSCCRSDMANERVTHLQESHATTTICVCPGLNTSLILRDIMPSWDGLAFSTHTEGLSRNSMFLWPKVVRKLIRGGARGPRHHTQQYHRNMPSIHPCMQFSTTQQCTYIHTHTKQQYHPTCMHIHHIHIYTPV